MRKYVLKRIGLALVTAFIILSATYLLMKLLPYQVPAGFPTDKMRYFNEQYSLGFVIKSEVELQGYGDYLWTTKGTDLFKDDTVYFYYQRPVFEQYFSWLWNIIGLHNKGL